MKILNKIFYLLFFAICLAVLSCKSLPSDKIVSDGESEVNIGAKCRFKEHGMEFSDENFEWKRVQNGLFRCSDGDLGWITDGGSEDYSTTYFVTTLPYSEISLKSVIDTLTFADIPGRYSYYKDKNNVYMVPRPMGSTICIIDGADPKTFKLLNDYFAKDRNNIYMGGSKMDSIDYKTFKTAEDLEYYSKDKNGYYNYGEKIDLQKELEKYPDSKKILRKLERL